MFISTAAENMGMYKGKRNEEGQEDILVIG